MLVLALDPGETVGFAVVGDNGIPDFSGGFGQEETNFWINFLSLNYAITHIIVEASPQFTTKKDRAWTDVMDALKKEFTDVEVTAITPGAWKPLKDVLVIPTDRFGTQHEKDAVMIARYHIRELTSRRSS